MLPTTDLLPLDLSTASGQPIDSKQIVMPGSDIAETFSDVMREPLLADQTPIIEVGGEVLPPGGSQLPVEQRLERGDDLSELLSGPDLSPITPTPIKTEQTAVAAHPIDLSPQLLEDADVHLPLAVVNPAQTAVRVEDQLRSTELRRQSSEIDPFARRNLTFENGQDRSRAPAGEPILLERQQPLRELQDGSNAQNQRSTLDLSLYRGEQPVPETTIGTKIEGGEAVLKPKVSFNATAINDAPINPSQVRQSSTGSLSTMPSITTTIDVPITDKAWGNALQDRVMWMTGRGIQNAEIRLNPAELGPIRVQVSVENDAAQLAFSAHNPVTRDAIELMMPRLREMLSENGLSLGGSTVSDGDSPDVDRDQNATGPVAMDAGEGSTDETVAVSSSAIREPNPAALIDTFA